jgi:hypothetical protein
MLMAKQHRVRLEADAGVGQLPQRLCADTDSSTANIARCRRFLRAFFDDSRDLMRVYAIPAFPLATRLAVADDLRGGSSGALFQSQYLFTRTFVGFKI